MRVYTQRGGGGGLNQREQRKFIDWKKTKLFRFRWKWDEEKKLLGIRLQISSPFLPRRAPPNLFPHLLRGGGKDFVDTIIAVKMLKKGMIYNWFYEGI